jgi:hypothetical protein
MHGQLPVTCHVTVVQPRVVPRQHLYCQVTCPSQLPCQHPVQPSHPAMSTSVQPHVVCTATCQPVIGPRHVRTATCHVRTVPRVIFVLVQLNPKMPKLSDMCHLLVLPRVLLTSS